MSSRIPSILVMGLLSYLPLACVAAKYAPNEQEIIDASAARREATNRREMTAAAAYDQATNPRQYLVRVYGNTAVLNFLVTDLEQYGDKTIVNEQRRTETWHRQAGKWLLIAAQWDNTPVNFRKSVATDSSLFKDYVGRYEWRPGDVIDTISEKDGRLWSRFGDGSADLDEYLPACDETFFVREGDLGTVTFQRDAARQEIEYTAHRVDGQDIFVRKLR